MPRERVRRSKPRQSSSLKPRKPDARYWNRVFRLLKRSSGRDELPSVSRIAEEKKNDPFRVLVSTVISLRTKDRVTLEASARLFAEADTPATLAGLGARHIARLIYPAGFYKTKAVNLVEISRILIRDHSGKVPADRDALLALPGVGRKTANLVLNLGFGIDAICVDTHVHRISNRLGWVCTKKPEETEYALEEILPRKFWIPLNELLVAWGQRVCSPISPFCSRCPLAPECPRNVVTRTR